VSQFPVAIGEAKLIHNVQIHKCNSLTDVHLAIAWESTSKEHWYIISTEPTNLQSFREYGFRFTIEENFLDHKSSGFNLEDSKLRSAPALSRPVVYDSSIRNGGDLPLADYLNAIKTVST
jgi:hypothetical protein